MYIIEIILKKKYMWPSSTLMFIVHYFGWNTMRCSVVWANSLKSLPYITYIDENANGVLSWHLQKMD